MNKMLILILVVIIFSVSGCKSQNKNPITQSNKIVINNVRVIVGDGSVFENYNVLISDGKIDKITNGEINSKDAKAVDGTGKSLMPGLIDTHIHIFGSFKTGEEEYTNILQNEVQNLMSGFLKSGITTVKSLGDPLDLILKLKNQIKNGEIPGPRLLVVGPNITAINGHPAVTVGGEDPWLRKEFSIEVESVEDARDAVKKLSDSKVDMIKLVYQGGMVDYFNKKININKISSPIMKAIIDEAHLNHLRITAHTNYENDVIELIESGIDGIEHGVVGLPIRNDRTINLFKEKNAYFVPTLQILKLAKDQTTLEIGLTNLKKMDDKNVKIAFGTDMNCGFQAPGVTQLEEIDILSKAGFTAEKIISFITKNAAEHLGLDTIIGTVEVGKNADLILINGNPLLDISQLNKIDTVLKNGSIVFGKDLKETKLKQNNPVSWFDIPVTDIKRAKNFYESVFKFKMTLIDTPFIKLAMFPISKESTGVSGSIIQTPNNKPSKEGTVIYFNVDNIDETLSMVEENGGKVTLKKVNLGKQMGFIALFEDCEGNIIGLRMVH
ncbi:MAG: hypothetical protein A2015_00755 [Spirochaetes bacterium GWF1_31_7]|nr:MAG: hypothetical protein A2Y30_12620 [Spirochaetes bacterium GWE1_32_154]OHD51652.1 MAG: hypothetical protein A2Y29_04420 [Spirochaetes bacterium GWE2_31_10]OHD51905.1 MAG: hypothetical protein A2015_00755 [Spirochaetes bacterium GWF1_31_7]OHD81015.1 MAG: hypothetical protein A2355_08695 [Spirochaetes bacterium RIFOXYB1_FULL_32_8]HBD93781.1 hypothetical protein [Spirochaetia bacterium]